MATNNLPQPAPSGQPQDNKNKIITDWLTATEDCQEALRNWKAYLRAWQHHPHVVDEAFLSAMQDMNDAGLFEWLNGCWADIDALRRSITNES